ncbi:hypothetical protein WJX72_004360 [[Myrmecia] bisecta]|uniref:Exonuclease domain-containing protein n=1 Tax=[Myrmecia] bisecta TaxID=41462 RepID=A0AAW1QEW8_9CHLO
MEKARKIMAASFSAQDTEVLVRVVKQTQRSGIKGSLGDWKTYVKTQVKGVGKNDPAHHSWKVLAAFVATLDQPEHQEVLKRLVNLHHQEQEQERASKRAKMDPSPEVYGQGGAWDLVRRTAAHANFKPLFDLPCSASGWVRTSRHPPVPGQQPILFGLDCEMCETAKDLRELAGFCLVNAAGRPVLQALVKPRGPVLDYRSFVTGMTDEDFQGVEFTRADAQRALLQLLQAEGRDVVLVGHALHHDLRALRLDHLPVIDTSLIFSYKGLPGATPSLADLYKAVIGRDLREGAVHDCMQDAAATMALVQHQLQQQEPTFVLDPPQIKVPSGDLRKLLVHSIPPGTTVADLQSLWTRGAADQGEPATASTSNPSSADEPCSFAVEGDLSSRKVLLVFKHPGEANDAFKRLAAKQQVDCLGRAQKDVTLQIGSSKGKIVKLRKMGAHNGMAYGQQRKPKKERKRKRAEAASNDAT